MQCEGVGEGWVRAPLPATPHTERLAIESQSLRTRTISVGRDEDEIAPPPPPPLSSISSWSSFFFCALKQGGGSRGLGSFSNTLL
eukprot:SAG25_NODE_1527_length_2837_cov_1.697224_1_plen_84_part_10